MGNSIDKINAENLTVNQTSSLISFVKSKNNILKLTHETNTEPPMLPQTLSYRTPLVENFIDKLSKSSLLHIQGEIGTGKTQLCNLIIRKINKKNYWFKTKEYKEQIKTFIVELNKIINKSQEKGLFKLFNKDLNIEDFSIIVLDDLPNLVALDIEEDFIELISTCEKYKIQILSSSNYSLPDRIKQYTRFIESVHIPLFNDDDTIELLDSYQAPEDIKNYVKLINVFSDNHPKFIIPTINYLLSNDWKINFDDFFQNKFIKDELKNFQIIFDTTIKDIDTKELAYRLNCISRTVTEEEIRLVSNIEPKIKHPFSKLNSVLNAWIFKEGDKEYLLSPLLYKLGSENLDLKVEQNINLELGHHIFSKVEVNPYEISRGINYYIKAKETSTAAFRLFQALYSALDTEGISENDMFSLHSYWTHTNLPVDIEIGIKLLLRTVQIILNNRFGNDIERLYEDYLNLEDEIISSQEDNPYALTLSYMLFSKHKYKAFEYGLKFNQQIGSYSSSRLEEINLPLKIEGVPIDTIFILNFELLTSLNELKKWIDAIKKLDTQKLKGLFNSELGIESIQPLQHTITAKIIKSASSLELQELHKLLMDLSEYVFKYSIINIWASLVSSAVNCLIETNNLDEAYSIVTSALAKTDDNNAKLILTHYLALKYVDKQEYNRALELYINVIDIEETFFMATLVDALSYASIAFSFSEDYLSAKTYMLKSINLYKKQKSYDELLLAKLYGEYSIMLWALNLKDECLLACENILLLIEKNSDNLNEDWKANELVLAHCIGYFESVLRTGKGPEKIADDEEYAKPQNRFYLYTSNDLYTLFDHEKRFLLYYQFYSSFYTLYDKKKGIIYLHKSFELSKNSTLEDMKMFLYKDIYLAENNFTEYFKYIQSYYKGIEQEITLQLIMLSLFKLVTELVNSKNKIKEFKTAFVDTFSETINDKYFNVMTYTLDSLDGIENNVETESNWLTQRIYALSEVQKSSIQRAIDIHKVFYADYFIHDNLKLSNVTKIELLENYFFAFWIQKINTHKSSFLYTDSLLKRLNENYDKQENPKDKISDLLTLVERYRKK